MVITSEELKRVIELSQREGTAYNVWKRTYFQDPNLMHIEDFGKHQDTPEYAAYIDAEKRVVEFISGLNYEAIFDLEGLMDYGRDIYHYQTSASPNVSFDEYYSYCDVDDDPPKRIAPMERFKISRSVFSSGFPEPTFVAGAVDYLLSKGPLPEYLTCSGKALGLL